jgi:hypothetical protein
MDGVPPILACFLLPDQKMWKWAFEGMSNDEYIMHFSILASSEVWWITTYQTDWRFSTWQCPLKGE